jgi:predicted metal-dependent hydrolase
MATAAMHPLLRFTLDLFESNQALDPVSSLQDATTKVANHVPARTPSRALAPHAPSADAAHFRHPRASREIRLAHALIGYEFKRGQRRSIGFSVGPEGLAVRAPKWVPLLEVDAALQAKAPWILRKLQESRERHAKLASQTIDWRDGASLPYLGQVLTIRLDPERRFAAGGAELDEVSLVLHISLPHSASSDQIRDRVQAWLMQQAKRIFQERLDYFAPRVGVQWKKLSLSNAATRWGSARADGSIRLNWRLVHFRMSVLDYVVAHELSHLRVMDHSPRFWDTVRAVVPDYAVLRQQLKSEAAPHWR